MANKSAVTQFQTSWTKTVNWAKQNNIPQAAYYPVYQLDSQRLLTSTPMSEGERIRAIQAAAGLDYSTSLPTDKPAASNIVQNAKTNAANIFTGLNPVSLGKNIFDTVTHTLDDPGSVLHAFSSESAFVKESLAQHSILGLIPGVADIAQVLKADPHLTGDKGFKALAENPLSSLLDAFPIGRLGSGALATTDAGRAVADSLKLDPAELAHMQPSQIAWKMLRARPTSAVKLATTEGSTELVPLTIGDKIDAFRNLHNIGSDQAELLKGLTIKDAEGTKKVEAIAAPAVEAIGKLSKEDQTQLANIIQNDRRSAEEVLTSPEVVANPPLADALEKVIDWGQKQRQIKMQAGDMVTIRTPFGDEKYNITPGSAGTQVLRQKTRSEAAQTYLDKQSKESDYLMMQTHDNDVAINGYIQSLHTNSARIYASIKNTIASLPDDAADRARSTLPAEERWDRSVPQDTVTLRNLLGLGPSDRISLHALNAIRDLFAPNGLLDKMYQSYEDRDFTSLRNYSAIASRKFDNKIFDKLPHQGTNDYFLQVKALVKGMHEFSRQRVNVVRKIDSQWEKKVKPAMAAAMKEHDKFVKTAIDNPPDIWDNVYLENLTNQIMTGEHTADLVDRTIKALHDQDPDQWPMSKLDDLRSDPRTIIEIGQATAKASLENNMLPDIPYGIAKQYSDNAYTELSKLRATGQVPHYIPRLSNFDVDREEIPNYNLHIGVIKPKKESALKSRIFSYKPSVYDLQLGILKGTKEALERDTILEFHSEYVTPHLHDAADTQALIRNMKSDEIHRSGMAAIASGVRVDTAPAIIQRGLDEMNLVEWDPESIYGSLSVPKLGAKQYIDKDIARALQKNINTFQLPAQGFWDKGTKVFRFSILGLSPRYTAHILFGGTYLMALRGHASMFKFIPEAIHYAHTGEFSDATIARFPHANEAIEHSATQEGQEDIAWHYAAGRQMGNLTVDEFMSKHQWANTAANKAKAVANINYRFTRAIVKAQRAITYLDGAARANKSSSYFDTVYEEQKDSQGNTILNHATGKPLYTSKRVRVAMSDREAHNEGMQAVASVMGDLRHMTPLERSVLTKAFPFYGWTKHILSYVLSYPFDHPYRASILSQLATQNSADVASGLPTRIQLLFFLGQPDAQGNVSAVDDRFLDPLRDVANYASFTGLFESLNPIITALPEMVNSNFTFGGNTLYPNLTYDSLYGTKEAGPSGNLISAAEGFVPQLGALDAAFNLSGQYADLKSTNPGGFAKKVFESLNVPFAQVQHINLRQIAAKDELDRYSQAENDAYNALQSGDFTTLDKYPGTVPDPLGTGYNVTPAYLKALYKSTEQQYGLPPLAALPELQAPNLTETATSQAANTIAAPVQIQQ